MNKLPDHLPRRYIIKAIHLWDAGETHQFQPARLYEIEYLSLIHISEPTRPY